MSRLLGVAAAILVCVALLLAPHPARERGVASRDFEAYWAAGRTALEGASPYQRAPLWSRERDVPGVDGSREELLPFVSPPIVLPLFEALARLPYERARALWLALLVAACALGTWASFAVAGWRRREAPVVALIALTFSPLTATIALGQLAGLAFAALALALLARGRGLGAVALACSAVQPNLAIGALAGLRRSGAVTYAVAIVLLAAGVGASAAWIGEGATPYVAMLAQHGSAEVGNAIQHALPAMLGSLFPPAYTLLATASFLGCVALVAACARRFAPPLAVAFACALLPFAMPFFHHQDLIVVLIPAAFALAAWHSHGVLLGALGTAFVAVDWLHLAQQPAWRWEDILLAGAAACALAALRPSRRALWLALPPLLALALAPLAAAHPLPLWPFALPPGFHAPAGLDASAVWAGEQAASGLTRVYPLSLLLRALSLLGCGLLAVSLWPRAGSTARAGLDSRTSRRDPDGSLRDRD